MNPYTIDYLPATEGLGHTAPLEYSIRLPVLGVPLEVRSNSRAVIEATERSFGGWRELDANLVERITPRRVDIVVQPGNSTPRAEPVYRMHGDCFLGAAGADVMSAQLAAGTALAFVTPQTVADDVYFRATFLESMALLLISPLDRVPLHAGAVVRNGRAVLLAGRSGTGKSSLCYACVRAGFQLLADDVVHVGVRDGLSLWGNPWRIHLLPDAPKLFPELADLQPTLRGNGKLKLAIDIRRLGRDSLCLRAEDAALCFVSHVEEQPSTLEPLDRDTAIAKLCAAPESGFDIVPILENVAAELVTRQAYVLRLGRQPAEAVALLESLTA